jgi:thiol-disulfide isomerase/thioredoxin
MKKFSLMALSAVLVLGASLGFAEGNYQEVPPGSGAPMPESSHSMVPMDGQGQAMSTQAPNQGQVPSRVQWMTSFAEASQKAKQENKALVLLFTGSDWCGWCKKMDQEVFADAEFIRMAAGRFVFVELDFPMNKILPLNLAEQNAQLKYKYGITGYPTVVV